MRRCLRALHPIRGPACDISVQDRHRPLRSATRVRQSIVWFAPPRRERLATLTRRTSALQASDHSELRPDLQARFPLRVRRKLTLSLTATRACFVRLPAGGGKSYLVRQPSRDAPQDIQSWFVLLPPQNRMLT